MKHLSHLEDLYFTDPAHYKLATESLSDILKFGWGTENLSCKIDGSPAFVMGRDSAGFFVATKSFFNVKSVRYYSVGEISDSHMVSKLRTKMIELFLAFSSHLDKFYLPNHIMGDFMFSKDEADTSFIKPNILSYENINHLSDSKVYDLGVCLHTYIHPQDNNKTRPIMKEVPLPENVFNYTTHSFSFPDESLNIKWPSLWGRDLFESDENQMSEFISWHNRDTELSFSEFIEEKYEKIIASKIRQDTKEKWRNEASEVIRVYEENQSLIRAYIRVQREKNLVIEHLNKTNGSNVTVDFVDGQSATVSGEGYVLHTDLGPVKLVKRYEFSIWNRSDKVVRGWDAKV